MLAPRPPKDSIARTVGLCAAALLAAGLGYAVWGPGIRVPVTHWQEVWVTIVKPGPATPVHADKPGGAPEHGPGHA